MRGGGGWRLGSGLESGRESGGCVGGNGCAILPRRNSVGGRPTGRRCGVFEHETGVEGLPEGGRGWLPKRSGRKCGQGRNELQWTPHAHTAPPMADTPARPTRWSLAAAPLPLPSPPRTTVLTHPSPSPPTPAHPPLPRVPQAAAATSHRRKRNVEVRQPEVQVGEGPQRRPRRRRIKRPGWRRDLQNFEHELAHVLEIALQLAGAAPQRVRDRLRDLAARQAGGVVGGRGAGWGWRPEARGGGRSSAAGRAGGAAAAAGSGCLKWEALRT
jgi:hypothetical protein